MDRAVEILRMFALYNRVGNSPEETMLRPELVPNAAAEVLAEIDPAPQSLVDLASIAEPVLRYEVAPLLEEVAQTLWPELPQMDPDLSNFLTSYWLQCMEQRRGEPQRLFDLIYYEGSAFWLAGEGGLEHFPPRYKAKQNSQNASRAMVNAWKRLDALSYDAVDRDYELDPFEMSKAAKRLLDALAKMNAPISRCKDGDVVFAPARR